MRIEKIEEEEMKIKENNWRGRRISENEGQ